MNIKHLDDLLRQLDQPKFRLSQIKKAIYQNGVSSFLEITSLPRILRDDLNKGIRILSFDVKKVLVSKDKRSIKALLKLQDDNFIETVLMSPKAGHWSVCVSSQAGCPLGCTFCATGKAGFKRNLTAEEITDQVLFWKQYFMNQKIGISEQETGNKKRKDITNIVYMGMGEPFLNWNNVKESLEILTDKGLFGFGGRSISVSTAGIPDGIIQLAKDFPQINLAVSFHFADDILRNQFMPVNKKYDLHNLREAIRRYFLITNRKIFLEYIMLQGINDGKEQAYGLAKYINSVGTRKLLHINLISCNNNPGSYKSSSMETIKKFKNYLLKEKINTTIRKSLGADISGACGQLAGKNMI